MRCESLHFPDRWFLVGANSFARGAAHEYHRPNKFGPTNIDYGLLPADAPRPINRRCSVRRAASLSVFCSSGVIGSAGAATARIIRARAFAPSGPTGAGTAVLSSV